MCSGLWIFLRRILRSELRDSHLFVRRYSPSNRAHYLTPRTTRCSMLYASLRSYKAWALRIPRRYCTLSIVLLLPFWLEAAPSKIRSILLGMQKGHAFRHDLFTFLNQRLPILPGRFQPSTFGVYELNYCVRDGNRWILVAIATEFVRACTLKTT